MTIICIINMMIIIIIMINMCFCFQVPGVPFVSPRCGVFLLVHGAEAAVRQLRRHGASPGPGAAPHRVLRNVQAGEATKRQPQATSGSLRQSQTVSDTAGLLFGIVVVLGEAREKGLGSLNATSFEIGGGSPQQRCGPPPR